MMVCALSMFSSIIDREKVCLGGEIEREVGNEYEGERVLEEELKRLDIPLLGWNELVFGVSSNIVPEMDWSFGK